jgi:MFS transporter, PAT family, beta-lactamase induction signal transducer AmpG
VATPEGTEAKPEAKSKRALLWTSTTYFGEGLPWSFLHQMGTEFLTQLGVPKSQIASTSGFHLAVTFKFLWSPLVDLFGRKRTWLWVMQVLLGLGMIVVGIVAPRGNLTVFWSVMAGVALLHAVHDIACDGFYLQALDKRGQALYSGTRMAAYRAAMWVGKSALVVLAGTVGWFWGFGAAGALMLLVAVVNAVVMPHPAEHHPQDAGPSGQPAVKKSAAFLAAYKSFFTQPQAALVLSFMFVHRLGDIMMFAMATPLLKDIGIDTKWRGVLSSFGTLGFMVGTVLAGGLLARLGLKRCLVPMTYFQNLMIPLYIGLAVFKPTFWGVLPVVIAEQFAAGVGTAANAVFLMQRCRRAFSASHYAMATVIVSVAATIFSWVSGALNEWLGNVVFFTVAFLASFPSLVLVHFVPKDPLEPSPPAAAAG